MSDNDNSVGEGTSVPTYKESDLHSYSVRPDEQPYVITFTSTPEVELRGAHWYPKVINRLDGNFMSGYVAEIPCDAKGTAMEFAKGMADEAVEQFKQTWEAIKKTYGG